jgi:hypothetical protein
MQIRYPKCRESGFVQSSMRFRIQWTRSRQISNLEYKLMVAVEDRKIARAAFHLRILLSLE